MTRPLTDTTVSEDPKYVTPPCRVITEHDARETIHFCIHAPMDPLPPARKRARVWSGRKRRKGER